MSTKKQSKKKLYALILISLLVQSFSTVLMKYASLALNAAADKGFPVMGIFECIGKPEFWSYCLALLPFVGFLAGSIIVLMVFSVMWQLLLERMELTSAYLRKGIYYILVLLWSCILFGEKITFMNILGSIIIMLGLILASTEKEEG